MINTLINFILQLSIFLQTTLGEIVGDILEFGLWAIIIIAIIGIVLIVWIVKKVKQYKRKNIDNRH